MALNTDQSDVISILDQYLQWHNLPVRMNKNGICNGLVTLYAKYALQGREQEFLDMQGYIGRKNPNSETEDKINQFIYEVILTLFPEQFDKKLNQARAMRLLTINNKPLNSAFDFAMTGSDNSWAEIIKSIDLKDNEVMNISGSAHVIAVTKKNNEYIVYDPNYSCGIKKFADEKELMAELHYNVFGYHNGYYLGGGPVSLMVNVIRHPENKEERTFPQVTELYDKYLTRENINDVATSTLGEVYSTLENAAIINDAAIINYLITKGAVDKENRAALTAVAHNNPDALAALLFNKRDTSTFQQLFGSALIYGREEAFDKLLQMKGALPLSSTTAFASAAQGGNPALLAKVIRYYDESHAGLYGLKEAIPQAIKSGSAQCVKLIIAQLNKDKQPLDNEAKMTFLLEAIRKNQPRLVSYFIDQLPPESLKTVTMNNSAIVRTDLFILHQLQKHGVIFSDLNKAVIEQKEHRPVAIILAIGIMLTKFTDFCAELLSRDAGVSYKVTKGAELKGRFFEQKNRPDTDEPLPPVLDNRVK